MGELRWKEWGNGTGREDLQWWIDVTTREAGRDALPVSWVAIDDRGHAVGAVGLAEFDLEERRDRSPWLIGMIVADSLRGGGIGGALVQELLSWAGTGRFDAVWVATGGRAVDFYRKHGWQLFEVLEESSGETTILTRSVQPQSGQPH